uniref:Isoprene synthase, chloroplastic n=2 Tax=Populus trichocarpa TaxID=3694 RepID=U5GUD6_POPTR|eukprot:XP_006370591.1 (-)-germacrene D synthase isoform X1 [Populus trichocarpa]
MSVEGSAIFSTATVEPNVSRRSASFPPSIWGDHFLSYATDSMETSDKAEHKKLKEEVKRELMTTINKPSQTLDFIDAIQRLGISYHFEMEIDEILREMYRSPCDFDNGDDDDHHHNDLYAISLKFRLLRQQGYKISCDVFGKFKNSQGNFNDSLVNDTRAILSFYEATHLRVHGDEVLEEALVFTTSHLEFLATHSSSPLRAKINHALKQPIRKNIPRLEARNYFSVYQEDPSCSEVLLNFAKLDFNILQKQHQKELSDIAKWWKELDFAKKLPFARDRVIECYFWILGVYFEPEHFLARRMLTKVIAMTSVIDDIYDVYGKPEELELFTDAIERWEITAVDLLPEYMKVTYKALLDVYTEIEENMVNEERSYRVYYAKEAMKNQVRAYYHESKWFHQKHTPTMEEYMAVALVTSAYAMLAATSFVGMGRVVTKDSFDWLFRGPKILKASEIICRLMDDIVSHKFEQKRGHVASSIECYMKQHGTTEQETVHEFRKQVTDAWKDVNEEFLHPTAVPMPLLTRMLNLARVIDVVYKDEDGYTNAGTALKDLVSALLIDPVPM